ncbi:DUF4405 domain-containing protein [Magnetovibrio sp.]|uniref:DUF4405 domain-containing protein n=1 Tax=Magnetovibrio sp. TaxID=2024836 RepID=UPI002F94472C
MSTATPFSLSAVFRKIPNTTFQTFLQKYATAATAATFMIVAVSGVLLFFHLGEAQLMGVHEWLGLTFVGAAVFHVTRHLKTFSTLLSKRRTHALFAVTAMIAAAMIVPASFQSNTGNPMKQFVGTASTAPIAVVAAMVGKTPQQLIVQFTQAGVDGVVPSQSLNDIAKAQQRDMRALFRIVMSDVKNG